MATTQSSVTAPLGNQGARSSVARYTALRPLPICGAFAELHLINPGDPSAYFARFGSAISAAAASEGAAAVTPTTTPTITGVTVTPAGFRASMGLTDEASFRATADNDPAEFQRNEISHALQRYIQTDPSVGLTYQFTQITSVDGNSGSSLTRAGILRAADKVWAGVGSAVRLVAIIDAKGKRDLSGEAMASAGAAYGNVAMSDELRMLLNENPFLSERNHVLTLEGGLIEVFCESELTSLLTVSGDKVGCVFVPGAGVFPGQESVMPAFAIVAKSDPIHASRASMPNRIDELDTQVGPVAITVRSHAGAQEAIRDGYGSASVGILSQAAACRLLYAA